MSDPYVYVVCWGILCRKQSVRSGMYSRLSWACCCMLRQFCGGRAVLLFGQAVCGHDEPIINLRYQLSWP